ncbi:unannotated protein [freshwater metagenome]|uniref:Unannotated protein n=1 Tax=freshwater metagenome TaxID=449393 RepID=A0A6J6P0X0_9ZZZZ
MKGSSRASFASARASLDKHLQGANNAQATALSSELFLTLHALDSSIALRRGLTDPSRSGQDKVSLVDQLVSKHIGPATVELLHLMVASRWSSPIDLSDAIEWLAVEAQAAAADADGTLDRLEEELFRFGSIVAANPELRSTLANRTTTTGVLKSALIADLLSNKTAPATLALISVLVDHPRGRNLEAGLNHFAQAASERRNQVIAHVKSATVMSDAQVSRLSAALAKQVGRNVRINVEVDKAVVGGISIRFADELIDGTVVSRLAEAGRRLVS